MPPSGSTASSEPSLTRRADLRPFHLAIPVDDLAAARDFYGGLLNCPEGRSSAAWIDFDLFGHQLVVHLAPRPASGGGTKDAGSNEVDGHDVPVPHFGVVLSPDEWHVLAERLKSGGMEFIVPPHQRFAGQTGEQWTMFFRDPSGNALEFKALSDPDSLFRR